MPNPYAARVRRTASEVVSGLDTITLRLQRLGATPDEVAAMAEVWDHFDEDWTPERQAQMLAWDDTRLAAELAATRSEYEDATDPDGVVARQLQHRRDAALTEAFEVVGLSVKRLVAWVDGDPVRAEALLSIERDTRDPRSTLVTKLERVLDAAR